nr:uncharacterized protein LOC109168309 [Ipomoea batatas]
MNVGAFTNFDQVISFLDAEDPKPKTRTIDHILLALPLVLDVTPETELPFTQVSEQPAPTPLETDNLTTQVLRQSIEELNKAVDIMVKRRNLDLKALRIMAWTANTSTVRPQALHPETTAPAPAVFAAAPATNVNTVFDPNDSASSFFLHPNENPSLVLISEVLNGRNYHPWARAMEMALLSKNKLGFVDGTVAMPDVNDIKFPYWKRCNNMVSAWITRSLLPEIAQTVLWAGTAERIWKTLKSRFSEADIFRVSNLHAEIHQVRQGDLSTGAYFAKLKLMWDELLVIRHLPTCNCIRRCDCEEVSTQNSPLDMGITPQANLIAANFIPMLSLKVVTSSSLNDKKVPLGSG